MPQVKFPPKVSSPPCTALSTYNQNRVQGWLNPFDQLDALNSPVAFVISTITLLVLEPQAQTFPTSQGEKFRLHFFTSCATVHNYH
jgi:hypothetical protein